jgi:hypothetical protein
VKTNSFLLILCLILPVLACKKANNDVPLDFSAKKDGSKWITTSSNAILNTNNNSYTIIASKQDQKYNQEENLFLSFSLSYPMESNTVKNFAATWYYVVGSDQISDKYSLDSSLENAIQISNLDTINKTISGTFNIKLIRDKYYPESRKMSFTNGTFNLKYKEVWSYK